MAELRHRHPNPPIHTSKNEATTQSESESESNLEDEAEDEPEEDHAPRITPLDILRVLVTLLIAACSLSYYLTSGESILFNHRPWFTRWAVLSRYIVCPVHFPLVVIY